MPDYGTDINTIMSDGTFDLDPYFRQISGVEVPQQIAARRVWTSPGDLIDDPSFGAGLNELVNGSLTNREVAQLVFICEADIVEDERIYGASVALSIEDETATADITITLDDGEFRLVTASNAGQVTTELLGEV